MKLTIILLGLMCAFASSVKAQEFSIGHGIQYSGLVGAQAAWKNENHNIRASLGLIGAGIGYDYFINDEVSLGGSLTKTITTIYSLNATYYLSGNAQQGFRIGLDVGRTNGDIDWPSLSGSTNESETRTIAWFSVGYQF
jgi:hypothetical protein